ncbi:MAG: RHS repeat-associated core domain-containing protein [Anaerolineae bacterium]
MSLPFSRQCNPVTWWRVGTKSSRPGCTVTGGGRTAYAGAVEVSITGAQRITKTHYSLGGQLAALRVVSSSANVLYYLHGDHLGSVSLVTCGNTGGCNGTPYQGAVSRQMYSPYGTVRWSQGAPPTDIGFTGQRADATGLMFYQARYYSASLGRFLSADSIVPSPANPQSLNRYAYVLNSPLRYTDPTGHYWCPAGSIHCIEDSPPPRTRGAGTFLLRIQALISEIEQTVSVIENAAQQFGYKSGIPRYETNLDGWKMTQPLRNLLYDIQFEIGHKQGVRFGESPWLVTSNGLRHYSEDGNSWIEMGTCPPHIAQGTRASRISSSYNGVAVQTEIRQTSAATIESLGRLNIQSGAELAFSGKFPGVEGRDVYYMHLNATYHGDRVAALTVAAGVVILGPKAWAAIPVILERFARVSPAFGQ